MGNDGKTTVVGTVCLDNTGLKMFQELRVQKKSPYIAEKAMVEIVQVLVPIYMGIRCQCRKSEFEAHIVSCCFCSSHWAYYSQVAMVIEFLNVLWSIDWVATMACLKVGTTSQH